MRFAQRRSARLLALLLTMTLFAAACGDDGDDDAAPGGDAAPGTDAGSGELSGDIVISGSSTVEPISIDVAGKFGEIAPDVNVAVSGPGTGDGFQAFCNGETDISDASRAIKDEEAAACESNDIAFAELIVANDALTVVVNKEIDFVDCLTVEQLTAIWASGSTVANWNEVDPSFPDLPLDLYGPGTDSGTFDYFTAEINGEEGNSRTDYEPSEDDNVIVQGVSNSPGGMGYFGFTYFEENADSLKALEIDGGEGCVAPSVDTAQDNSYTPLSRPLFIYVSDKAAEETQVSDFVNFYIENIDDIVTEAQYVPLTEEQKATLAEEFEALTS